MLYLAGKIKTQGRVDKRNTFLDTHELERERGITIVSVSYTHRTRIIERTSSQPIVTGDISDDGSLLLVTRSREPKYVVEPVSYTHLTTGLSPAVMQYLLMRTLPERLRSHVSVETGETCIPVTDSGLLLPSGATVRAKFSF